MKNIKLIRPVIVITLIIAAQLFSGCTKVQDGFLSPFVQYAVSEFSVTRGRIASSYSLVTDGSSIPLKVRWTHIYDSTGKVVDDIFLKKYPITVWTAAYNPLTDKDYASILAKRKLDSLPPIMVNESNGTIEANSGTINLPLGTYTMDLEVSNGVGVQELKKLMKIKILDGKSLESAPEQGAFAAGRAVAGTASVTYFYNGQNNPFVKFDIKRMADTPNILLLKFTDRNDVPFNPKTGEIIKRPNAGLNPNPPFLQNLQDYAPDTYAATNEAISIKYPLAPFPIASLGNGYNMYYHIKASAVQIDSISSWTSNSAGIYYQGNTDSHYLGTYVNGRFDYSIRVPMRIQVPGSYQFTVKILNATHR